MLIMLFREKLLLALRPSYYKTTEHIVIMVRMESF